MVVMLHLGVFALHAIGGLNPWAMMEYLAVVVLKFAATGKLRNLHLQPEAIELQPNQDETTPTSAGSSHIFFLIRAEGAKSKF